mgnify:CR=1 FL=1
MIPQSPILKGSFSAYSSEVIVAKNQDPYLPLPAIISTGVSGRVTTRWHLDWSERLKVLWSGDIWLQMLCFQKPVTPAKIVVDQPSVEECLWL